MPFSLLAQEEEKSSESFLSNRYDFYFHSVHLIANLLDPQYCGENLLEDDLMRAIETLIETAKNTPEINEVKVMSDIAEYRAKQKLWSREVISKTACNIIRIIYS